MLPSAPLLPCNLVYLSMIHPGNEWWWRRHQLGNRRVLSPSRCARVSRGSSAAAENSVGDRGREAGVHSSSQQGGLEQIPYLTRFLPESLELVTVASALRSSRRRPAQGQFLVGLLTAVDSHGVLGLMVFESFLSLQGRELRRSAVSSLARVFVVSEL